MCGIAGIYHDDPAANASERLLSEMCERIIHRGPDGGGQFVDGNVALGHRRLSIIDVSGGDQPIFNEDRNVLVVFNGEIYNHKALRRWLTGLGHTFVTQSDTEVLVHQADTLIMSAVAALDGLAEAEMVRNLMAVRATLSAEGGAATRTADVGAVKDEALRSVNEYFERRLRAVPTISDYVDALAAAAAH